MRSRTRIVVVLAIAASAVMPELVAQSPSVVLQPQIDKIFSRWTGETPGCAVAGAVKGQTVVRSAYGMADLERNVPITPSMVFDAGSVAKQFTATAMLLLARDGKLSLDDPVHKYVPELPDYGVRITIRQMLNHTSGLRDWAATATLAGIPHGMFQEGHGDMLDVIRRQRTLNFPPGTRWSYSNSGYILAAIIVARLSGMSFADFTTRRIFEPLGMRDTSWQQRVNRIVKSRALGYSQRQNTFIVDMPLVLVDGPGGLLTTVDDLLKWNDNFARPIVGDAALLRELQQNARFVDGRTHEYAMGLVVDTYRGVPEADHSGAFAGYRAYVSRYLDQQVSIAVLCNSATANPTQHGKALAQLLLSVPQPNSGAPPETSYSFSEPESQRLIGLYRRSPQAGAIRITSGKLVLLFNDGSALVGMSQTRLRRADNGDTLDIEDDGRRLRYVDEFGTVDIYERVEPATPTADQLRALTGDYYSEEIDTTWRVALDEGNQLVIRRRPEKVALTPVYADAFSSPIGMIVFERDRAGRITALSLTEERVWNLRFDRRLR